MKMIKLVIIVVVVFSALGLGLVAYGNTTSEETNMNYGISMTTDKTNYSVDVGDPIVMTLKIFNYNEEDIVFNFNTSQRYDFIIEDEEGNEIWRWSQDRMFATVLGEETLGPDNPQGIYMAEYKDRLGPGYYKVTGIFVAQNRPMSGSIIIEVK